MNASRPTGLATRTGLALPALLLLTSLSLFAQGRPADTGPRTDAGPERPIQVVAHFLELSEVQIEQWVGILQGLHESVRPLAETLGERQRELEELVRSDAPDPTTVGSLLLEIRDLRRQIHGLQEQAGEDFELLLDDAQRERLDTVRRVAPLVRILPAFRALYLL